MKNIKSRLVGSMKHYNVIAKNKNKVINAYVTKIYDANTKITSYDFGLTDIIIPICTKEQTQLKEMAINSIK